MKEPNKIYKRFLLYGIAASLLGVASHLFLAIYFLPTWGNAWTAFVMLGINILLLVFWFWHIDIIVSQPVLHLQETIKRLKDGETDTFTSSLLSREDEIGALSRTFQEFAIQKKEQIQKISDTTAKETAYRTRQTMKEEICRSALPQVLPDIPSRSTFSVAGFVEQGAGEDCQFYDYFYIDPGLLCIVLGQILGGGIEEALYMVVAQTTIRSRLRQGRSLEQTMADVNEQLYDLGSSFCLNALVAVLSTSDGRLTYVNAGQQQPLFMRNEERYEWLDSPIYAPLGMNEKVSYRSIELRLKQGDQIFLHTLNGDELKNQSGVAYAERRLQEDLNVSRSQAFSGEDLLQFLRKQIQSYCPDNRRYGFSMLSLLYCKGDKELAHCDVPAYPTFSNTVTAFLKSQFEENHINKRHYARQAVIIDEIFALCCRQAEPDSHIVVECGVAPDAQMVTIRIAAILNGVNPLENAEWAKDAVKFIENHADYVTFKAGEEKDTITVVSFLEE